MPYKPFKIAFVLTIAAYLLLSCTKSPVYPEPETAGGNAVIDISLLKPGVPVFFSYNHKGKRINFFVLKNDGPVESYFDACMRCYPKKLGYVYDGGEMLCRACGMRYPATSLSGGIGSCYPIKLMGVASGGGYLIRLSAIEEMSDKF